MDSSDQQGPQVSQVEFAELKKQFARTDFNYPFSDDPDARDNGRRETALAKEAFQSFASKSTVHAAIASQAWDDATDLIRPPDGYLTARQRENLSIGVEQKFVGSVDDGVMDFATERARLQRNYEEMEAEIAQARPEARPALEKMQADIVDSWKVIEPDTTLGQQLASPTTLGSIYAAGRVVDTDRLDATDAWHMVSDAVAGTGIDADEVIERLKIGARNEYLEQKWVLADIKAMAEYNGLEMDDAIRLEAAKADVEGVYGLITEDLRNLEIMDREIEAESRAMPKTVMTALNGFAAGSMVRSPESRARIVEELQKVMSPQDFEALRHEQMERLRDFGLDQKQWDYLSLQIARHQEDQGTHLYGQAAVERLARSVEDEAQRRKLDGQERDGMEMH